MRAIHYHVITEQDIKDLEERVNIGINNDKLQPIGGISASYDPDGGRLFHQAMIEINDAREEE